MVRLILLLGAVAAVVVFVNWLLNEDPKRVAAALRRAALWAVAGLAILLTLTEHLPWVLGLVGASVPLVGRLLSLARYVPVLSQLYGHYHNARNANVAGGGNAGASHVRSKYLHMTLDHASGELDGKILEGLFAGRRLSGLGVDDLLTLLGRFRADDGDSAALLQDYLDRYHPGWERRGQRRAEAGRGSTMSRDEAGQILGVSPGASREEIIKAHRRLMQKLHPDRGGSDYLAAKVNQAKELLLGE